jgi:hypothetical protein
MDEILDFEDLFDDELGVGFSIGGKASGSVGTSGVSGKASGSVSTTVPAKRKKTRSPRSKIKKDNPVTAFLKGIFSLPPKRPAPIPAPKPAPIQVLKAPQAPPARVAVRVAPATPVYKEAVRVMAAPQKTRVSTTPVMMAEIPKKEACMAGPGIVNIYLQESMRRKVPKKRIKSVPTKAAFLGCNASNGNVKKYLEKLAIQNQATSEHQALNKQDTFRKATIVKLDSILHKLPSNISANQAVYLIRTACGIG